MFEVPPPFNVYEKPVFVEVLVSDDEISEYVFGTLVGGEGEKFKVRVDTVLLRHEGLNLEELKVRADEVEEKEFVIVHAHKEDIRVDEEKTVKK